MAAKKPKKGDVSTLTKDDYERIGRDVEAVVVHGYADTKRLLFANFLKGVATGVGALIGATIVLTVLLWLLSVLGEIPFIGEIFEKVRDALEANPEV